MKLSVIIPVYNEVGTVIELVNRVLRAKVDGILKEVIIVDDASTDGTDRELKKLRDKKIKLITKAKNQGKGAAIRDGLKLITGDIVVIQDADLEYDPNEYKLLVEPIKEGKADVVFGSRFIPFRPHRVLYFWHMVGNKLLTLLVNAVTNMNFTDMETCYKAFTREVAKNITIAENRFGFEPEFTIKVSRMGYKIYEVGISYSGGGYDEGKKINWKDGMTALGCVMKYGLVWQPQLSGSDRMAG